VEKRLFEQFKENLSLAKETPREGLRSVQAAWRKATLMKRQVWLLVPTIIVISAVAEHFSVPWYYEAAGMLVLVVGSWMLGAMWRSLR
jgi:hypothetical protein